MQSCYGNILKSARKAKKMTQEQVAEHLNISTAAYQTWEASKYIADEYSLLKLEKLFGDDKLAVNYLQETSPVWKEKAQPLLAAIAIKEIYERLEPLIPHLTVFLDTASQLAC